MFVVSFERCHFTFDLIYLSPVFLVSLIKCQFNFFKEPAPSLINLLIVFFVTISFIYTLLFVISFLLLTLGFICFSFYNSWGVVLGFFIWDFFLISWSRFLLLCTYFLKLYLILFLKVIKLDILSIFHLSQDILYPSLNCLISSLLGQ